VRRREFIARAGGALVAWPLAARGQPQATPVIGFLNGGSPEGYATLVAAYGQGLHTVGYVENQNVAVEYRWARGQYDRLPAMATDLVRSDVAVIAATSTPAALAAKSATATIPIVFETASDPVRIGLVASLNRPGGNITGVTQSNIEVAPKRLELLHELVPKANAMALLVNPANAVLAETQSKDLLSAASALGLDLHFLNASSERHFDDVFTNVIKLRVGGLVISTDPLFTSWTKHLATLAARHGVPAAFARHEFTATGGLLSYGTDAADAYRLVGIYTGRILKGEKPADLAVQQSTKVELSINVKTAKALGLTIPPTLLARADEVIE